ncbi:MAG: response regulator [Proteobacteria bacterium]|nr:response regulator [Pseudomonadota bacterium]
MDDIRFLIVDDESQFVEAVVERLRLRGLDAKGVTNGYDALKVLCQKPYDVLLLDVKMPGLGGLDVIRKVKEKWPDIRVVLLTGHGSKQDAEEGMQLGAFKYLMKPVNIEELISILYEASAQKLDEN